MLPKARSDRLLVSEVDTEIVLYDLVNRRAHSLNATAAFVWRHADGETEVEQIAQELAEQLGMPRDEQVVWLALERLDGVGLLETSVTNPMGMTRRQLVKRVAAAGVALVPLIRTITAPTPLMAQSGGSEGPPSDLCAGVLCSIAADGIGHPDCIVAIYCDPATGGCVSVINVGALVEGPGGLLAPCLESGHLGPPI